MTVVVEIALTVAHVTVVVDLPLARLPAVHKVERDVVVGEVLLADGRLVVVSTAVGRYQLWLSCRIRFGRFGQLQDRIPPFILTKQNPEK